MGAQMSISSLMMFDASNDMLCLIHVESLILIDSQEQDQNDLLPS